ncbi:ABC-type transport system substrate-binding protein [Bradyrhizobium yuanmingense]
MFRKLSIVAFAAALVAAPLPVLAQSKKDSVVMGMTLEPPGLDPTNAAAAAIAEVTLYNIYETLIKINEDGSTSPLLAESWTASPDLKTYTFKLRKGVKFHNGEPFDAAAVKFSFERNAAPTSTNKDKSLYQAFEKVETPNAETVVITVKYSEPNLPFLLGQAGGSIVEPKSAATNVTQPVGHRTVPAWRLGQGLFAHAEQMGRLPQRLCDQAVEGDDPLHLRSGGAGRGVALERRRRIPAHRDPRRCSVQV